MERGFEMSHITIASFTWTLSMYMLDESVYHKDELLCRQQFTPGVDPQLLQAWQLTPSSCRSITHSHADYLHGGTKTGINASLHLSDNISCTYG